MAVPLDQISLRIFDEQTRTDKEFPALDCHWKVERNFLLYQPPPCTDGVAEHEQWLERLQFIQNDLHWLLRQPHDKFWCQVVYDETLHTCLDSYLKLAPRSCDLLIVLPPDAKEVHDKVHRMFFMVCLRMATHKESMECFITLEVFGDIIYENCIFDIPKLMDLSVLYGAGNGPLLTKMISNIFKHQPKYEDDLRAVIPAVLQLLDHFMSDCGIHVKLNNNPQPIGSSGPKRSLDTMSDDSITDVVSYLADTARTLCSFLDVFHGAAKAFSEDDFLGRLASAYQAIFSALTAAFTTRKNDSETLRRKTRSAQVDFVKFFRQVIFLAFLQPIMENSEDALLIFEEYLEVMSSVLSEKRFLGHLEMLFPFADDLDLLLQCNVGIDETNVKFIADAMKEAKKLYHQTRKMPAQTHNAMLQPEATTLPVMVQDDMLGACATLPSLTPIEIDSAISAVKDLLPELGDGFVEACLEQFSYSSEAVINAVLDNNLPTCLAALDRAMPRKKMEEPKPSILDERRNVYDNDEFDVFHREHVDLSKIHAGKRDNALDMDDKSHLEQLKPLYQRYGSEFVESMYDKDVVYEDEYDDTYDSNAVGADDTNTADEMRRPNPVVLKQQATAAAEGTQDSDEETEEGAGRTRERWIEDPARVRQRQADHWAAQRGTTAPAAPTHDTKGNPKGQGQSAETLRNRAWKEKHKTSRVNHNRRALADRKRRV